MSWLRDDDDMLDHEKWRRAIRDGGDGALLVWARLRAWCSRRLTDGVIPADMVDEVAEIGRSKARARALRALIEHGLCARDAHGVITIVGYLERNPSRAKVLEERDRRSEAQRKRRLGGNVTGHAPSSEPGCNEVPSRPVPSRPVSLSSESEDARAPEVENPTRESGVRPIPDVPGLTVVGAPPQPLPGPLPPSKRDQADAAGPAPLTLGLRYKFRPDWDPSPAHRARGHEYGLTDEAILERAEDCRNKPIKHGFTDEDEHFFRELIWMKRDREKQVFKSQRERDAFEMPGKERRA